MPKSVAVIKKEKLIVFKYLMGFKNNQINIYSKNDKNDIERYLQKIIDDHNDSIRNYDNNFEVEYYGKTTAKEAFEKIRLNSYSEFLSIKKEEMPIWKISIGGIYHKAMSSHLKMSNRLSLCFGRNEYIEKRKRKKRYKNKEYKRLKDLYLKQKESELNWRCGNNG